MTLLELLIVLAVLSCLAGAGFSSYGPLFNKSKITGLTNELVEVIKGVQQSAIMSNQNYYFDMHNDQSVNCWSIATQSGCHCNSETVAACSVHYSINEPQYKHVTVNGNREQLIFSPMFGYSNAGSYKLSISGYATKIVISSLGRIRICTYVGDINLYAVC